MGYSNRLRELRSNRLQSKRHHNVRKILGAELLEDRLLLTITPSFIDGHLLIDDRAPSVDQVLIGVSENDELILNGDIHPQIDLSLISSMRIYGGSGNDAIDISVIEPRTFPLLQDRAIVVFGGGGDDTISGSQFGDYLYGGAGDDESLAG